MIPGSGESIMEEQLTIEEMEKRGKDTLCVVKELTPADIANRDLARWSVKEMYEVVKSSKMLNEGEVISIGCYFKEVKANDHATSIIGAWRMVRKIFVLTDGNVGFRLSGQGALNIIRDDGAIRELEERIKSPEPFNNTTNPGLVE